jgi:hypothetical protein
MTSLTPRDYDEFLKLRIPRDVLDRAKVSRVERLIAEEDYGIRIHGHGGILFSHFLPPLNGNDVSHPAAYSVRDDNPKYDAAGKPERKYVFAQGRQYPYTVPVEPSWYQDPAVPVILVEAAKSALALLRWCEDNRRRLIPVGIAGCYGWRGVTGIEVGENGERGEIKGLNPVLASICRGHRVYILLDQNAATNPHVQRARAWLADTLLEDKITNDVRILSLPPAITAPHWNGPDDFIAATGDEGLHELFEDSVRWRPASTNVEVQVDCVEKIRTEVMEWFWPDRIPQGCPSVISGPPDVGKTTIAIDLIARYTTGREWPDGTPNTTKPGNVLILVAEDGVADTIKPRLLAAGATVERVFVLRSKLTEAATKKQRYFTFDQDLERLEQFMRTHPGGFGLVVTDPLSSYLGKADMNKEQDVRRVLGPIREVCERTGVAFLSLGHFNKRSDVSALNSVSGAVANTGIPRAVFLCMKDPQGEKGDFLMLLGKGNLTKRRTGLRYRFAEKEVLCDDGKTMGVPIIDWKGEADIDADDAKSAAAAPAERASKRAEAFLQKFLADDDQPSAEILAAADKVGIKRRTLFEVKKELGIKAFKRAGTWWWSGGRNPVDSEPENE